MPTILVLFGLRVVVYPNDHRPAHVHVQGNGYEAVFMLSCPDGPPVLRENYGFTQKDLARVAAGLSRNLLTLCAAWRQLHDDY